MGPVLIGGIPGVCMYLTSYEYVKEKLTKSSQLNPFIVYMSSALFAEAFCCIIFVPVDVMKERMQIHRSIAGAGSATPSTYSSTANAVAHILREEGLRGVYRGYGATLASYGPFACLYFTLYEKLKESGRRYLVKEGESKDLSFLFSLTTSAFAGSVASAITSPLDMIKLRLQVQHSGGGGLTATGETPYTGMLDGLSRTYRREGLRGLFRGAGARVLFFTPSTAITMASFETCKRWWLGILQTQSPAMNT